MCQKYESPTSSGLKVLTKTSKSRLLGQNLWYAVNSSVKRYKHVLYKNPTSSGPKVMTKVKILESTSRSKSLLCPTKCT